jgi:putative heme-binding domain-containing protein
MHNLGNADVNRLLEKVWGRVGGSSDEMRAMIARLRNTYTTAPLWAYSEERGRALYQKTCAACHPLDGSTVPLGPGLAAAWRNGLDYFLENVVDPNAVVGETYRLTLIVTTSGTVVSGLLDRESDTAVVLRTAEKTVTVPKAEIEERRLVNESLMPTGLLDKLSETETIELLKFLTGRR